MTDLTDEDAETLRFAIHDLLNRAIENRTPGSLQRAVNAAEVMLARSPHQSALATKAAHAAELLHELRAGAA